MKKIPELKIKLYTPTRRWAMQELLTYWCETFKPEDSAEGCVHCMIAELLHKVMGKNIIDDNYTLKVKPPQRFAISYVMHAVAKRKDHPALLHMEDEIALNNHAQAFIG